MKYAGFYVNLDRNPERKERIEQEMARNGLSGYTRFRASDGNELNFPNPALKEGEMGCFTSHYRLMMENKDKHKPIHVIEDDIVLSTQVEPLFDQVIETGELAKYDIIYTDVAVPLQNTLCIAYKSFYDANVKKDANGNVNVTYCLIDLKELAFGSTCSYLVNPQSIGKLASLFESELKRGARVPVDIFIRKMCQEGALKVISVFPFITSIKPESCFASSMEKRFDDLPVLATNMLRHSFFIGCDMPRLLEEARKVFPQPEGGDVHRQLMISLLGYTLTPGYHRF